MRFVKDWGQIYKSVPNLHKMYPVRKGRTGFFIKE